MSTDIVLIEPPDAAIVVATDSSVLYCPVQHLPRGRDPLVILTKVGNKQILEHRLTGEVVELAPGHAGSTWVLERGDCGFAFISNEFAPARWVNDILAKSVWLADGDLIVKTSVADSPCEIVEYFKDVSKLCKLSYASWPGGDGQFVMPLIAIVAFDVPRDGATTFLNLKHIQDSANFKAKYPRSTQWFNKQRSAWLEMFERCGMSPLHLYKPVAGDTVDAVRLDNYHCSVAAAIAILAYSSRKMQDVGDRHACLSLSLGIIANLIGTSFELQVDDSRFEIVKHGNVVQSTHTIKVSNLVVEICTIHAFGGCVGLRIDNFLQNVLDMHPRFCSQVFTSLGRLAEIAARETDWPSDPLVCLTTCGHRRPSTRHLRLVMNEMPTKHARNAYRGCATLKRVGLNVPLHRAWADAAYARRYIVAMQYAMSTPLSYGLTFDKGRRTGKDWLRGVVVAFENKTSAILIPIVACRIRRRSGRYF
jgi:hypothetical protein